MLFAVGLADFDFFAAEMEVFVFGVADGPTAGMVVQVGQRSFAAFSSFAGLAGAAFSSEISSFFLIGDGRPESCRR